MRPSRRRRPVKRADKDTKRGGTEACGNGSWRAWWPSSSSSGASSSSPRVVAAPSSKPLLITATAASARSARRGDLAGHAGPRRGTDHQQRERSVAGESDLPRRRRDAHPGQAILAIDGRDSVTAAGGVPRSSGSSTSGRRVPTSGSSSRSWQAAGYSPGTVDELYTEQTRFALAQWQADHNYPGATPQTSRDRERGAAARNRLRARRADLGRADDRPPTGHQAVAAPVPASMLPQVVAPAGPTLTIISTSSVVRRRGPARHVRREREPCDIRRSTFTGVARGHGDVERRDRSRPGRHVPAGASSTTIQILDAARHAGRAGQDAGRLARQRLGPRRRLARFRDDDDRVQRPPAVTLTGSTTVQQGQSATLTVTADQAPVQTTQVGLTVSGTAMVRLRLRVVPAGRHACRRARTATLTINTKTSSVVEPDRNIVTQFGGAAATERSGEHRDHHHRRHERAMRPPRSDHHRNQRACHHSQGQPAQFTIGLDRALTDELQVNISFGGDAEAGTDYNPPGGLLAVPPGETTLPVTVPILDNGRVQPDKQLVVTWCRARTTSSATPASRWRSSCPRRCRRSTSSAAPRASPRAVEQCSPSSPTSRRSKDTVDLLHGARHREAGSGLRAAHRHRAPPAGQTSVTVPVLTVNKDVMFLPTDMIVGDVADSRSVRCS